MYVLQSCHIHFTISVSVVNQELVGEGAKHYISHKLIPNFFCLIRTRHLTGERNLRVSLVLAEV